MVTFVCEECNETLKKAAVARHSCVSRGGGATCVDCSRTFYGAEHAAHTSCVSEAEKHQKGLYRGGAADELLRGRARERQRLFDRQQLDPLEVNDGHGVVDSQKERRGEWKEKERTRRRSEQKNHIKKNFASKKKKNQDRKKKSSPCGICFGTGRSRRRADRARTGCRRPCGGRCFRPLLLMMMCVWGEREREKRKRLVSVRACEGEESRERARGDDDGRNFQPNHQRFFAAEKRPRTALTVHAIA